MKGKRERKGEARGTKALRRDIECDETIGSYNNKGIRIIDLSFKKTKKRNIKKTKGEKRKGKEKR